MQGLSQDDRSLSEVHASVDTGTRRRGWRRLLAFMGPAYLVSVGYMDPGNWATDIAGGSAFGYALVWVLLMSNIMALLLQSLAARLGIVRGLDLAQASRATYPKYVNYVLYVFAEVAIAATDLAEILGMAIGLQLLFGMPLLWGVSITVLDTFLFLLLQRLGMRKMEAFIIALIAVIGGSFVVQMVLAEPDIGAIARGLVPSLPGEQALYLAIGIIGATVMPHNLYLHSALVQTRRFDESPDGVRKAIKYNFIDSAIALNLALFVNAAILILAAAAFYENGLFEIAEIQDAHRLLEGILGSWWAPTLFAVALIAAGQSSTITGTLAGQIVMEGYLRLRIEPWIRRLLTRLLAVVPAFLVILVFGEEETGPMLIFSQVLLSLQLGFAIIPLIHFVSDRSTMGSYSLSRPLQAAAWVIALVIVSLNVKLVYEEVAGWLAAAGPDAWILWVTVVPLLLAALGLLIYLTFRPVRGVLAGARVPEPVGGTSQDVAPVPPSGPGPAGVAPGVHPADAHARVAPLAIRARPAYRCVAVPVDFSRSDEAAVNEALALGGTGAEYVLIHVVESAGARFFGGETRDAEVARDRETLATLVAALTGAGYRARGRLEFGRPRRAIASVVDEVGADLVVMGAHGHAWLSDLVFGTTIEAVRHAVRVPVLLVRAE